MMTIRRRAPQLEKKPKNRPIRAIAARLCAAPCAGALAATLLLGGCGGQRATAPHGGTAVLVADHPAASPRRTFGGLRLGMSQAELLAQSRAPGWQSPTGVARTGPVTLTPPTSHEASQVRAQLEAGRVVQIAVTFRHADARRASLRHSYARSKVQADGSWAMTDRLRRTLVIVAAGGSTLVATDLSATRDKTGVRAMLERYLGE